MTEAEKKAERSRLLNKQKTELAALEKSLKKAKGMMKEKIQKDLVEMEARHEAELQAVDDAAGGSSATNDAGAKSSSKKEKVKLFPERSWYKGFSRVRAIGGSLI